MQLSYFILVHVVIQFSPYPVFRKDCPFPIVYSWLLCHKLIDCSGLVAKSCQTLVPSSAACQASLSYTISRPLLKFISIEPVMVYKYLIVCVYFYANITLHF